jgi:uncharacterized protein with ParB-like and HNH nuclease domain
MAFDFGITTDGELIKNISTMDIKKKEDYGLRLQLAYNRLKSVSKDWFIDECGADLEELIGKPCTPEFAELGAQKINNMLVLDSLWSSDEFFIYTQIKNDVTIEYSIYFKIENGNLEDGGSVESYELNLTLDLVKGVNIRYGWDPRRTDLW